MKDYLYIFKYLKPFKFQITILSLILIVTAFVSAILPYLTFTVIIDQLLPKNDFKMIIVTGSFILILVIFLTVLEILNAYLSNYLGSMLGFKIRFSLFRHLQTLSLKFYSNRNSGEILERLNRDVAGIQGVLSNQIFTLLTALTTFAFLTIAVFYISWELAIPMMLIVLIQSIIILYVMKSMHGNIFEYHEKESKLIGYLQERVSLVKLVQVFVKQKYEAIVHQQKSKELIEQMLGIAAKRSKMRALSFFTRNFAPLLVVWMGCYFVITDRLQIGALVAMWIYSNKFMQPVEMLVNTINQLQDSLVSIKRIKIYLDEVGEIKEIKSPIKEGIVKGDIEFKNITFAYEEDKTILKDISFKVKSGSFVAMVGESGSGKSTVTNLLFRFYDPQKGEITLDGYQLKEYGLHHLRKNIGVVFQDTDLFVATLRDNLAYGAVTKVTDEEIMVAAEMSLLGDLIRKLPNGLDTMIEERGTNFSGGEKQRIAICRLIIRKPGILIFDEATSALDTKSEVLIQNAMQKLMKGPTSFVIAHRLSTIVEADKILVFKDGAIVEEGNHQELISLEGEYAKLWNEQQKNKIDYE